MRFTLFGVPVEIRPSFLLIAAFLGLSLNRADLIIAWVLIIFVSILVHELGHALTARRHGSDVAIQLNGIGGLTSWSVPGEELTPGRRALIAAAGSATGLAFGGLIWLVSLAFDPAPGLGDFVVDNLVRVNVFWGLLNWLPIRPLDGGHLFSSLLERLAPSAGERIANVVFFATAAIGLVLAVRFGLLFVGFITAWLLWGEISRLFAAEGPAAIPPLDFDSPGAEEDTGEPGPEPAFPDSQGDEPDR